MTAEVRVLAGPPRCGKTQQLLDVYVQMLKFSHASGLARACWLGPNQSAVAQLQEGLAGAGAGAVLSPNLYTFAGFAQSIIDRSPQTIRAISKSQKRRILRHASRAAVADGKLEHFAQVAETTGFITELGETIAQLKRSDVWPEQYQRWSNSRPRGDRRNREIAHLYFAYQNQLHQSELYDAEGRFWAAREILTNAPANERAAYGLIVVSGFNDFTTAQYDILRLLAQQSEQMMFSLTCEPPQEDSSADEGLVFAKTASTLARLQNLFPNLAIEYASRQSPQRSSLAEFQQRVFRTSESSEVETEPFGGVEVIAANSELGEIETIAAKLKQLLLKGDAKPEEIVLVHRGGDDAATRIAAVFPDFGIPYTTEQQQRLAGEPLLRVLSALLSLQREDWPFQRLRDVIGCRLLTRFEDVEGTAFELQPRVAMEACLRWAQLPAGRAALLEQLSYRTEQGDQQATDETDKRAIQLGVGLNFLRQLEASLCLLPEAGTIAEWILAIESLLQQLGVLDPEQRNRSREAIAWQALRRGMREIERVDDWSQAEQSLDLSDVLELIETVGREQSLPASKDTVGKVRILSAETARKLSIRHLFLAGLSESAFSAAASERSPENGQSPPIDADSPPAELVEEATPRADALLLFYELVSRPTESLTLSYSALDGKGQPLPPSPLLTDMQRSVGPHRIAQRTLTLGQLDDHAGKPLSRGTFRRAAVRQALEGETRSLAGLVSHPSFVRVGSAILGGVDCVAQRSERDAFGPFEGLLNSETARSALAQRFNTDHLWSPSRLEGYAACPFRFFGEQLLNLEPLNDLVLRNDARRRGSLLHQVLATIHEQLREEYQADDNAENANATDAEELVQRFLAALDAEVKSRPLRGIDQSLREIERREIEAWAPAYAEQETSYRTLWQHFEEPPRPMHLEVRFGPESRSNAGENSDQASTTLPFELELGEERILLTGQIDRVDIGRLGNVTVFNIIDYKSGQEVKLSHDKVRAGRQLQLPLYALAAEQLLLADQQALALATGYWNIRGKGFQTKRGGCLQLREEAEQSLKQSADWEELQPEILTRVQELVTGIRQGDFPVYNEDVQCTRSCELSTVCRVAQVRSLEKQWPPIEEEPEDMSSKKRP